MAEVLITLGIIGVVAAVTLPTLVANYQKTVWVNQLKKTYTTLNEGFKQIVASEGCTTLECASIDFDLDNGLDFSDNITKEKIVKEFKLENVIVGDFNNSIYDYDIGYLNGTKTSFESDDPSFELRGTTPDGAFLMFEDGLIIVDINGLKSPNVIGRDIYFFTLADVNDSVKIDFWGTTLSLNGEVMSENKLDEIINSDCPNGDGFLIPNALCGAKIIRNGWKMNY